MMHPQFIYNRKVTFPETDAAGVVHFSNFFKWMEEAECEFLESIGVSMMGINDAKVLSGFPKAKAQCKYIQPAKFGDLIEVYLFIKDIDERSLSYQFRFLRKGTDELLAKGVLRSVFATKKSFEGPIFEALKLPEDLVVKFQAALSRGES